MSSYKALYRKYRPQTFSDVVDQEYITTTLKNAIKQGKISHAYLFNGPRGIGKTTIARIFAKAINCLDIVDDEPCNKCDICKSILDGSNPDIIEIDAASRTKVDQMRETLEKVNYLPTMSKYKVYIIDEVHMLSTSSFNALLKTLEEPPKHVIFILCTTEVEKVIPTIRSRCQRFDFRLMSKEGLCNRLRMVADKEVINITDDAINVIAEAAEGGMRDALTLLDQVSAFSLNDSISLEDVLEVTGRLSTSTLIEIASSISKNDSLKALNLLDSLIKLGKEVEKITISLISFYKDILIIKNTQRKIEKVGYDTKEFLDILSKISNQSLFDNIEILTTAINDFKYSVDKRIYLEIALLKMCDKERIVEPVNFSKKEEEKEPSFNSDAMYAPPIFEKKEKVIEPIKVEETPVVIEKKEPIKEEVKPTTEVKPVIEEPTETLEPPVSEPVIEEETIENEVEEEEVVREEVKEETSSIPEYDIHFVEEVFNNTDKPFKEKIIEALPDLKRKSRGTDLHKYSLLLEGGDIVASSRAAFILSFNEVGHCNLIMKEENVKGVKELIKEHTGYDLSFMALPRDLFKKLSDEFVLKYRDNYQKGVKEYINLTFVKYPGLKINSQIEVKEVDDKYKDLEDLFGDIISYK